MNEREIFDAALALADPTEQAAFLERACGDDTAQSRRLHELLEAQRRLGSFLESPPVAAPPTLDQPPIEQPGTQIGPYKLLQQIGEGGMGVVYMAEQTEPVKRRVALKIIKPGMDTRQVIARFEAERQALSLMDHPNIAKVLDAGATESGRPYFVMELVKGQPITQYCDEKHLTPRQRLELLLPVCQAIQHAHQKGIIHRDIKPTNILVAEYDQQPVPKVIDFGVAKATSQTLTEKTMFTGYGQIVGTLEYMSPEQAKVNQLDIDTRSDIYSLGVLLYELLTGSTPFDRQRLRSAAFDEMLRIIREEEPPKPSTRLSDLSSPPMSSAHSVSGHAVSRSEPATLASIAAQRQTEPAKLTKLVRGELDWIVMKALEKDRARRYESATAFASDIAHYLNDEPVVACPPSAGYRIRKFVRRNKAPVLAASLVLLTLVAGIVGTTWGMMRAEVARRDAVTAQQAETERAEGERLAKLEAVAQTEQAQKRLAQIEKSNDILGSIFDNLDPKEIAKAERPLQAILVEKLDQAVAQLEGESIGDALSVAAMQNKFGVSLLGLGEPGKAIVLLEKARATRRAELGPEHPKTLESMGTLAIAYQAAGKLDLALPLSEETLKLVKAKLGPEHPQTLSVTNNLAVTYLAAGKRDLALPLYEETLKLLKAKLGPEHPTTLNSMSNLAFAYHDAGKLDLALLLFEETLKLTKAKLGPNHPQTLSSMQSLAVVYSSVRKLDLALPLLEETLNLTKAKLGPEHPQTLSSMRALGDIYLRAGKPDLALPLLEETLKLTKAKLGPEHPQTLNSMRTLVRAYCNANLVENAAATIKEFVPGMRKRWKPDDPQLAKELAPIGSDLLKCRQYEASEEILRECLSIREAKQPDLWKTFNTQSALGGALLGQKKYAESEPLLLAGYEGMKQRATTIPPEGQIRQNVLTESLERLVDLYTDWHAAEPDKGYDSKAAEWQRKLEEHKTAAETAKPSSTNENEPTK